MSKASNPRSGVRAFVQTMAAFRSDKRANVAVMFGLALVPLITAVGATLDYSRAVAVKDRLDAIADSAVLEGVSNGSVASRRFKPDLGQAETKTLFVEQAKSVAYALVEAPTVTITQSSVDREVTLEYSATVQNQFGAFLKPTTVIRGRAKSATSMPVYMDFFLLLDNSPSMGLGATQADIKRLEDNTPDRCAFACHEADKPGADYYALAKSLGVTMRIDVVRQATQKLIDTATNTQTVAGQFRLGVYTFNNALQEVSPVTENLAAAKTAAANIDLLTVPFHGSNQDRYTDFDGMMPYASYLPAGGNGTSSTSRKTVLFLVTDAVADEPTPGNPAGRTLKPIPIELCNQIKSRNIQIAALYTTYYPLPTNGFYNTYVAPFVSNLGPTMQQCASPGLYFEVSPSQGIAEAMQALFQKAVGQARLKP
jgi:Flp pilus assembly protein TadG